MQDFSHQQYHPKMGSKIRNPTLRIFMPTLRISSSREGFWKASTTEFSGSQCHHLQCCHSFIGRGRFLEKIRGKIHSHVEIHIGCNKLIQNYTYIYICVFYTHCVGLHTRMCVYICTHYAVYIYIYLWSYMYIYIYVYLY